jgi:hypothetical protein
MVSATWLGFAVVIFVGVYGLSGMLFRPRETAQKPE